MKSPFTALETAIVDAATLLTLFGEYKKPRHLIARLVNQGELIRLKNGLYLIEEKLWQEGQKRVPYPQVANSLYGPSYVSLEWALSFYGMIPERVFAVTSMTLGKKRDYTTPVGLFTYVPLSPKRYVPGVTLNREGSFLIATKEKALADLVYMSCRGLSKEEILIDLLESKRIERESLQKLDKTHLNEIAKSYASLPVQHLANLLGVL